jgi:hypothetical protein
MWAMLGIGMAMVFRMHSMAFSVVHSGISCAWVSF